ncbi:hypothetical protein HDV05_001232 [Chytridiales sp. JEL 0842]|nr:hypothetical protein HDV05_001232 [Chytridiales sp. JEL 0842]
MTAAVADPSASPNHHAAMNHAAAAVSEKKDDGRQVNSYEVGWLFVQEYYTFLNKEPQKLHLFYNSKSSFIHGTEGETLETQEGQKAIHKRITELDFQDCKVLVSNVDSQRSFGGCIVVMVLGEISNKGAASHKFAQTFVLAEQPYGYFVFNDMFRYLKEDIDNEYEESADPTAQSGFVNEAHITYPEVTVAEVESTPEPPAKVPVTRGRSPSPAKKEVPSPAVAPVAKPEPVPQTVVSEPAPQPTEQYTWSEPEQKRQRSPSPKKAAAEPAKPAAPAAAPWTAVSKPKPAETPAPAPAPAAPAQKKANHTPAAPAKAEPQPQAAPSPSKPKTWANLAATNSQNWTPEQVSSAKGQVASKTAAVNGTTPASQPAKQNTAAPKSAPAKKPAAPQSAPAPAEEASGDGQFHQVQGRRQHDRKKDGNQSQQQQPQQQQQRPQGGPSEETCNRSIFFIRPEGVTVDAIKESFNKVGKVLDVIVPAGKNMVFVEFDSIPTAQGCIGKQFTVGSAQVTPEPRRFRPAFNNNRPQSGRGRQSGGNWSQNNNRRGGNPADKQQKPVQQSS